MGMRNSTEILSYLIFLFKNSISIPVDTARKLNEHKTFRRHPGRLLNVLCTFNLCPVSTGIPASILKGLQYLLMMYIEITIL